MIDYVSTDLAGAAYLARDDAYDDRLSPSEFGEDQAEFDAWRNDYHQAQRGPRVNGYETWRQR